MPDQSGPPRSPSRRTVVAAGTTLLAGFGLGGVLPAPAAAAAPSAAPEGAPSRGSSPGELARYRPVTASSTAYAPTVGSFVVDRLATPGVEGSGWRAEDGDPQWIAVDLQSVCEVTQVRLVFEADASTPVFTPPTEGNPHSGTTGKEVQSSYALVFVLETSLDNEAWSTAYRTTAGTGGVVNIQLPRRRGPGGCA